MDHQLVEQVHQILVLLTYPDFRFFRQVADLTDEQVIVCLANPPYAEFLPALHGDTQAPVAQLIEVDDVRGGPDIKDLRRRLLSRSPGIAAAADEHHAEGCLLFHTPGDQIQIARLEDLQGQEAVLEQHGAEREEGQLRIVGYSTHARHFTPPRPRGGVIRACPGPGSTDRLPGVDWLQIIALALVQGITEFLPISSSAHLILPSHILGWPDQGLAFDVAVHLGTLMAVLGYFRTELGGYLQGFLTLFDGTSPGQNGRTLDPRLDELLKLSVATLPLVLAGFLLKDWVSDNLRSVAVIAAATIGFGLLLGFADRYRGTAAGRPESAGQAVNRPPQSSNNPPQALNNPPQALTWTQVLVIGAAQVLALIPGTSRSGITMTAALWLGLSRTTAARFSFLLAIPAIGGAAVLLGTDLVTSADPVPWLGFGAGFLLAAVSAYLCIAAFVALVERIGMMPFVIYRLVLGAALIWLLV